MNNDNIKETRKEEISSGPIKSYMRDFVIGSCYIFSLVFYYHEIRILDVPS